MSYVIMPELHPFPATCHEPGKSAAEELLNRLQRRPRLHAQVLPRGSQRFAKERGEFLAAIASDWAASTTPGKTGATKVPMKDSALTKGDGCDGWYEESQASD